MLLIIECILVIVFVAVALINPRFGESGFRRIESAMAKWARKRRTSVLVVGGLTLVIRALLIPILPIPVPAVHDEFSYLLMADTFAHGRMTNPTHPMWIHFETFHEIQKPTYASMYYPGQGAFLAIGQAAFGDPFWGVWLSNGLMCGAICWMLQGWLPPFWALLGGFLALIRLGIFSYWMNSYWGGSVAALGGALVLGAFPRIIREPRLRESMLMGLGFVMVASSRPYEGLFFGLAVLIALLLSKARKVSYGTFARQILAPLGFVLMVGAATSGIYFWRVTGTPFRTPFQVNIATYNPIPYFPWQTVKAIPHYDHEAMRKFYFEWWGPIYQFGRTHPFVQLLVKICVFWFFFIGVAFSLPLLGLCFVLPRGFSLAHISRRTRLLLAICGFALLGSFLPVNFNPHYAAAITGGIYALILIAMQNIRRWRPGQRPIGIALVRAVFAIIVISLFAAVVPQLRTSHVPRMATWYSPIITNSYRAEIIRQLDNETGQHLVIVRYDPNHLPPTEWVFNQANIDASRIVWARDMGAERNAELINYFKDRHVWLLRPDKVPPRLSEYSD